MLECLEDTNDTEQQSPVESGDAVVTPDWADSQKGSSDSGARTWDTNGSDFVIF